MELLLIQKLIIISVNLGENNCTKLASWPHETVPFYFNGYNGASDNKATEQIYTGSALSFVAACGMGDRYVFAARRNITSDDNGYFGWHVSEFRAICNNLIYQGMPEVYKSIIHLNTIASIIRADGTKTTAGAYSAVETEDYIFFPSVREIDTTGDSAGTYGNEVNTLWTPPWSWMVPAQKKNVLGFVSGSTQNVEIKTATINSYLYRFLGYEVKDNCRIFSTGSTDPTTISNLTYRAPNGTTTPITVQSGDLWVNNNDEAYMYFTNEEIAEGIKITISTTNGGWKKADIWNLRSLGGESRYLEFKKLR